MENEKRLFVHLSIVITVLILSVGWFSLSLYVELKCFESNGWFARSGAVLVFSSIFSALIIRPTVEDAEVPDYSNIYKNAVDAEGPLAEKHWTIKHAISNKLIIIELLVGTIGTITWAYGDLWLPKCIF